MPSSTSSSRSSRRSPSPILLSLTIAGTLTALWLGWIADFVPEDPSIKEHILGERYVPPTPLPYYAYRNPGIADLLILGDSRVDSGITEERLEAHGLGTTVIFTGPGAQLLDLLSYARSFEPRRLVVSLDPLAFYSETHPDILAKIEEEGLPPWPRRVDEALSTELRRWHRKTLRPIDTESWQASWFPRLRPKVSDHGFQKRLAKETRAQRRRNALEVGRVLKDMKAEGWDIVCIRVPMAPSLLRIENNGFKPDLYHQLCKTADVPFWDYTDEPYETHDGSHLAVWEARRFSDQLARDLGSKLDWRSLRVP